jgi:DNA-binding XRE family transcriptional regulator
LLEATASWVYNEAIRTKEAGKMLSENIKNLRKQKGYSQEQLAEKLNVVRQTVSGEKIIDLIETEISLLV